MNTCVLIICDGTQEITTLEGKICVLNCRKYWGCEKLCQAGISKVTSDLEMTSRETFSICFCQISLLLKSFYPNEVDKN